MYKGYEVGTREYEVDTRLVQGGHEVGKSCTRWVQGVRGGYEGHEVGMRGTRWVPGVRGGYQGYEVGARGTRCIQGAQGA